jgi:hypothetical protein
MSTRPKKKENVHFISDIKENAMNAKRLKSSALLGIIAGNILNKESELSLDNISIIDSLKIMTDIDFDNFVLLYEYVQNFKGNDNATQEFRTAEFYKTENINKPNADRISLEWTIEK